MRLAVGGFQHETNTFAPQKATFADFLAPDAWPGLVRGADLLDAVRGINVPAAGFIQAAQSLGHTVVPLTWCSATPSAHVTRDAYERIASMMLEDLRSAPHLDAIYLDLHGAMVAEDLDDADGELLHRVRQTVGREVPLIATLDFHANVSPLLVERASALIAYRSYPHIDMTASGERAMRLLHDVGEWPIASHVHRLPFLIPLTSQCTLIEPMKALMDLLTRLERPPVRALSFTPGFPAADVAQCGPAVFGYGEDALAVKSAVQRFHTAVCEREADFALETHSIESAMRMLSSAPAIVGKPTILADTQDNPGGGGTSDTTSLIKALIAQHAESVLAGLMFDPRAAARAHAAGTGTRIDIELGAHTSGLGETPIHGRFEVDALGDGAFTATGPFYAGARMDLGPMALLRFGGVRIAVSSRKQQAADQAMFRHLGIEPRDFAVLALKSSVHFRADFGSFAGRVLIVEAPGANVANPSKLPFKKQPATMRVAGNVLTSGRRDV